MEFSNAKYFEKSKTRETVEAKFLSIIVFVTRKCQKINPIEKSRTVLKKSHIIWTT